MGTTIAIFKGTTTIVQPPTLRKGY